jgi:hypothetical protein
MPQRGSECSPGRRPIEVAADHGLGSGRRLRRSISRQSKNWLLFPPSSSLNGPFHSFTNDSTRRQTCLILIQEVLLKTKLFLLIHKPQRVEEVTRLKCRNFLLHSHLEATDSKLSILQSKTFSTIIQICLATIHSKHKMFDSFQFLTHFTFKRFHHTSMSKIIPSHDFILRKQPQKNLDSGWNFQFPHRRQVNGLNPSKIN